MGDVAVITAPLRRARKLSSTVDLKTSATSNAEGIRSTAINCIVETVGLDVVDRQNAPASASWRRLLVRAIGGKDVTNLADFSVSVIVTFPDPDSANPADTLAIDVEHLVAATRMAV